MLSLAMRCSVLQCVAVCCSVLQCEGGTTRCHERDMTKVTESYVESHDSTSPATRPLLEAQ